MTSPWKSLVIIKLVFNLSWPEGRDYITRNIPEEVFLDVSTLPFQGIGVFAGITIEEKTIIGPVPGRIKDLTTTNAEELDCAREVADNNVQIQHILQMERQRVETKDLWIALIQPARCIQEQNLETFEAGGSIYYRATKEIYAGEELLVWYGLHIEQCFGLPCFEPQKEQKKCIENPGASEDEKKKLNCVICHKGFNSRSNLRSHMRTHTQQKPFKCNVCFRRFSQSSTLRNHTRLHTATRRLLVMDLVILKNGQMTRTTPELAPPLLTTTPHQREDISALDRFNVHRCPTRRVFCGTGLELETCQP
ncbi:PR domain zinc finger protein 12 [Trichonephila clavipes]|nr:PR domain zinc finger protein 12 [Trichonephila clavipes]